MNQLTKRQKMIIEDIVGDVYNVGHAHGLNTCRSPPKKVNEGWGKHYDKLLKFITREIANKE